MKERYYLKKILVVGAILLITLSVLPVGLSSDFNFEEKQISCTTTTDHYTNSVVIIIGNCNIVEGPKLWIFGLYFTLLKKSFFIKASGGEGEQLNVIIRGNKLGAYIDKEKLQVEFNGANGILFWGQKSIIANSSSIFARCKAKNIWITTYD